MLDNDCPNLLDRLSSIVEIDLFLDSLRDAIVFTLDDQAPLRSFPVRRPGAPWLSSILRALGLVRPSCMSPLNFITADELNSFFVSCILCLFGLLGG